MRIRVSSHYSVATAYYIHVGGWVGACVGVGVSVGVCEGVSWVWVYVICIHT